MKLSDIITLIAIVAIIGIYIDLRRSGALSFNQTVQSSDTIIVNLPPQTFTLPPSPPVTVINQAIPAKVDTMRIIQAYFAQKTYTDSIVTDTIAITLHEVVSENAIQSREVSYRLKLPLTTTIVQYQRSRLMAGGLAQYNSISPALGYMNRRQQFYFGSYDIMNKQVRLGAFVPVGR